MRGTNERGCWARKPAAANARPAYLIALCAQLGAQAAGAITSGMPPKIRADNYLPCWLWSRCLLPLPGVVRPSGHAQHLTALAYGHSTPLLGRTFVAYLMNCSPHR